MKKYWRCLVSVITMMAILMSTATVKAVENSNLNNEDMVVTRGYAPAERQTREVIGTDNRSVIPASVRDSYPYSAVGRIRMKCGDCTSMSQGTGYMVSENCMLTAGHCLYCTKHNKAMNQISIYFGYASVSDYVASVSVSFEYDVVYYPAKYQSTESSNYDYGYIVFNTSANSQIGLETGWFGLVSPSTSNLVGKAAIVLGYEGQDLKTNSNYVEDVSTTRIFYEIDTDGGQSGSPLYWVDTNYGYVAAGIHITGASDTSSDNPVEAYNSAWRITSTFINDLDSMGYVEKIT